MELKTKQLLSVILSIVGAGGTIATGFLIRKAAIKEARIQRENPKWTSMSAKEKLKVLTPVYIPASIAMSMTIGSIVGSTVMSHRAQASIMSMAVLADRGWHRYKHQVKSTLGLKDHENVLSRIAKSGSETLKDVKTTDDGKELYFEEIVGFFRARPEDIAFAYAEINEMLNTDYRSQLTDVFEFVTIARFLDLANAELIQSNKVDIKTLNSWGWTMDYLVEGFNWAWVNMRITNEVTDDGVHPFKVISWIQDPIFLEGSNFYDDSLPLDKFSIEDLPSKMNKED